MTTIVNHQKFGKGQVISQDEKNVTVDFNGNIVALVIKFSKLTNEDGTEFCSQYVAPIAKTKKLNKANFMSKEEFSKSKYSTMNSNDFQDELNRSKWASKSM
jgi:hypothetical protein